MISPVQEHQEKSVYPTIGDTNIDRFIEMVSARLLYYEVIPFPLGH